MGRNGKSFQTWKDWSKAIVRVPEVLYQYLAIITAMTCDARNTPPQVVQPVTSAGNLPGGPGRRMHIHPLYVGKSESSHRTAQPPPPCMPSVQKLT